MENEALAQEMLAIFDNSQPQNTASKVGRKVPSLRVLSAIAVCHMYKDSAEYHEMREDTFISWFGEECGGNADHTSAWTSGHGRVIQCGWCLFKVWLHEQGGKVLPQEMKDCVLEVLQRLAAHENDICPEKDSNSSIFEAVFDDFVSSADSDEFGDEEEEEEEEESSPWENYYDNNEEEEEEEETPDNEEF